MHRPFSHSVLLLMDQVQQLAMLGGGVLFCLGYCFLRCPQGSPPQLLQGFTVDLLSGTFISHTHPPTHKSHMA